MPSQIERMVLLLAAAREQRVVRWNRSRQDHLYGRGQLGGSVMRHLWALAPIEVVRFMVCLPLAGRDRRVQHHLDGCGQLFGYVMRHLFGLALVEVCLLPRRMVDATRVRLLVAPARGQNRVPPRTLGAAVVTVHIPVVAPAAQEEHSPTTTAADEA